MAPARQAALWPGQTRCHRRADELRLVPETTPSAEREPACGNERSAGPPPAGLIFPRKHRSAAPGRTVPHRETPPIVNSPEEPRKTKNTIPTPPEPIRPPRSGGHVTRHIHG